ncbi:MAG: peptide/nickel transport system permease protein [Alphaproteobacteria bacterium]|nr:peptide/nickel transport system permease protein [Alphaproteobacteria bacterium]
MGAFVIRRLYHGIYVVLGVTIVVFVVTRVIGDPVSAMLPMETSAAQRAAFAQQLGLDRPLYIQFIDFLADVAHLNLGESLWQHRPVTQIVFEKLPITLYLVGTAMALAIVLSIPLGIMAALKPGRIADRITVVLSLIGLSVPQFWLGVLLILLFAVDLRWLPTSGSGDVSHLILPALTLAVPAMTRILMVVRSSMMDELNTQHIKVAIAKGLPFRRVIGVHALRNIAIPVMTLAGWETVRALAGYSVVVETVFAWPGLGLAAVQAIERQDLILLQGIVFYVAVMVVIINIGLDLAQKLVDPRVKFG